MQKRRATLAALIGLMSTPAGAAVVQRASVDQRGDAVLIGNALAHNCAGNVPDPILGDVGDCGDDDGDSGADVLWGLDPDGNAVALASLEVAAASSVAVLSLPPGAVVTRAQLYWSAQGGDGNSALATLSRDSVFSAQISAEQSARLIAGDDEFYQSTADVTALVRARGAGAYRVSGVDIADLVDRESEVSYAAWWMVVFYELSTDPLRNLSLFDGFELVDDGASVNVTLSGFEVPAGGFDAKLGVVAYEGDAVVDGDQLRFGPALPLQRDDALLDTDNFFNSSRLGLNGAPLSVAGDRPRLSGAPGSTSGLDLDVIDVTDRVNPGQTSARIAALTEDDFFLLAGFVTSISTFQPEFAASSKTVRDLNGAPLRPGDELEYTISVINTGTDSATRVSLLDALPSAVRYVPGSLRIVAGAGAGLLSDAADNDRGEILRDASGETVSVRLGTGATPALGGRLDVGASSVIAYRVRVQPGASGAIENQAEISAIGSLGGVFTVTPTDGNAAAPGAPPTVVDIDGCAVDADCSPDTAFCDVAARPRRCVACLDDEHCDGLTPDCSAARRCVCVGSGAETLCDGDDDNCNGVIDEGFVDSPCQIGVGACQVQGQRTCATTTSTVCSGVPGTPSLEGCLNGVDDDCDGATDLTDSDCPDSDGDGLPDPTETEIGTDPADPDSDGDGVPDGSEPAFDRDTDVDGLINALDADSDNDALRDGTELGFVCSKSARATSRCVSDGDAGETVTNPLVADTDGGGVSDGSEDFDLDGVQDVGETDPRAGQAADDRSIADSENDGMSDGLERVLGADVLDADSDDDGSPDGLEANPSLDEDGDTRLSLLDPDSDGDGLFDGTETGRDCADPATLAAEAGPAVLASCTADGDPSTTTSPLVADSDKGGVSDGREDVNQNGRLEAGETDPNLAADDGAVASCAGDVECGAPASGRVCESGSCTLGCREDEPNSCPSGFTCVPLRDAFGVCLDDDSVPPPPGPDAGDSADPDDSSDAGQDPGGEAPRGERPEVADPVSLLDDDLETGAALGGGACTCRVPANAASSVAARSYAFTSLALALSCFVARRRRYRR